jgi:hypothetical protein
MEPLPPRRFFEGVGGTVAGWGSGSAYWRIGVWGSKTAFRHRYNDQEVSTELMVLCKRRPADTLHQPPAHFERNDVTIIGETVH